MHPIWRIFGIMVVFGVAGVAWAVLGGIMLNRTSEQSNELHGNVADLWGRSQAQAAPELTFLWTTEKEVTRTEQEGSSQKLIRERVVEAHEKPMSPVSTALTADVDLDQRLKGLMWYSLYNLRFGGTWTYRHQEAIDGNLRLQFRFPDPQGLYDDFRFVVDGQDRARELRPENGQVALLVPVRPGQEVKLEIGYMTRGMNDWRYVPAQGVSNIENFHLAMTTDFAAIDFPSFSMSPSHKERAGDGWKLEWTFKRLVTGHNMGVVMPERIQPGQLAAELSFSAPISLLFFFLMLFVLSTLKGIDLHPINYLFLAAAFFAFHLLFGYSVDHLEVVPAFALSSVVSILLVVSYLRLVVSPRFAFVEAGAAQLVYLVGFSLAHFWDGYTGLTVTVLSILTLFVLMQATGRIQWSEVLSRKPRAVTPVEPVTRPV